jgi:hypothetical protein
LIDFGQNGYDDTDIDALTDGGREILADGNAGGSSIASELFAFEVLSRCDQAILLKTETEIDYTVTETNITDLLIEIDGTRYGVSVTRAVAFPFDMPYPYDTAVTLLTRKLDDILTSTMNVAANDAWSRQVLSVLAYAPEHAAILRQAWNDISTETRSDTILYVTVTNGDDAFIY